MASRHLFLAAAALFTSAAFAQQPEDDTLPEKSVDQIRCELAGDCLELDLAPTADAFDPPPPDLAPPAAATRSAPYPVAVEQPSGFAGKDYEPGKSILMINFITDSAAFSESGRQQAERVFDAIHAPQFDGKRFLIAGHTNATGASATNLALSRRRAQALADYLTASGMARDRFQVIGYGARQPLPGVPARNSANRRVEITVIE